MEFRDIVNVRALKKGLVLYDPPTGKGKSYMAAKLLYENAKLGKKGFFITNNKKNLPLEQMKNFFIQDEREKEYAKNVLQIKSNVEFILDNFLKTTIPKNYQGKEYHKLKDSIDKYNLAKGNEKKEIFEFIREEYEPKFRSYLHLIIEKNFPKNFERRIDFLNKHKEWDWLAKIYPTVRMNDYSICFLTMSKFILPMDPLLKPSFILADSDLLLETTVILDEFDETKKIFLNDEIDRALKGRVDLLDSFEKIYHALQNSKTLLYLKKCDDLLKHNFLKQTSDGNNSLFQQAERLRQQYHLELNYKIKNGESDTRYFLLNDGNSYFFQYDKLKTVSARVNGPKDWVDVEFLSASDFKKTVENKEQLYPVNLIKDIYYFIEKFKSIVKLWGSKLSETENNMRGIDENRLTQINAEISIYRQCGFTVQEANQFLQSNVQIYHSIKRFNLDQLSSKLRWFEFINSDQHCFNSIIQLLEVEKMPEERLVDLANRASIIGLSTTALIPTVLGNYDLVYLKKALGKLYHEAYFEENLMSEQTKLQYQEDFAKYEKAGLKLDVYSFEKFYHLSFSKGKIKTILNSNCPSEKEDEVLTQLTNEIFIKLKNLEDKIPKKTAYFLTRYIELLESFCIFLTSPHLKSFLGIEKPLPRKSKWEFEEEFIIWLFTQLSQFYEEKAQLAILRTDNFEEDKEKILSGLKKGEKIYVLTSYETTGAGQNLQYEFEDLTNLLNLEGKTKRKEKDFDGIFLGNITYLVSLLNSESETEIDVQALNLLLEIEALHQHGELSIQEKNQLLNETLRAFRNRGKSKINTTFLERTLSWHLKATKIVLQAVGRLMRTSYKNSQIALQISPELLNKISDEGLHQELLPPEVKAIFSHKAQVLNQKESAENIYRRNRNTLTIIKGEQQIQALISTLRYDEEAIAEWKLTRSKLLTHPTVDNLTDNEELALAYIELPNGNFNSYYYFKNQQGDFYISTQKQELLSLNENYPIYEVSAENAGLENLLSYPGMEEYFREKGYATKFLPHRFIVSPIFFQQILKGAYGEVAGRFIVEKELGKTLHEIRTVQNFELFDFRDEFGNYYDFKNWRKNMERKTEDERRKIREKLALTEGKQAWIINLLKTETNDDYQLSSDKKIIEIPFLIDEKGSCPLKGWQKLIERELNND